MEDLAHQWTVRWREALEALVECGSLDRLDVFKAATKAVAAGLGYRFAGVGILVPGGIIQLESLWDGDRFVAPIRYPAEGSPCHEVFFGGDDYCSFEHVADRFPADQMLQDVGAELYRGLLIRLEDGEIVGHIFAIHDASDGGSVDAVLIMRLIAQWCARQVSLDRTMGLLRESRKELQEALTEAERANTSHRAFLANVSHELRTPLNAVVGFSEALAIDRFASSAETVRDYAELIRESAGHLLTLIDHILDISSVESSGMKLHPRPVAIAVVAGEAIALTSQLAERNGVALRLAVEPAAAEVLADELGVRQILVNLLSNAVRNTEAGGDVVVGTRNQAGGVAVYVRDSGVGIPKESIERILQPFQRVETGFSRHGDGSGLGLSIVAKLTRAMNGTLDIDSDLGRGTTVTVLLPPAV